MSGKWRDEQVAWNSGRLAHRKGKYVYNGLDRLDSNQGYVLTNCVPCCGRRNEMKMDDAQHEFLKHIAKIATYSGGLIAFIEKEFE